MYVRLEKEKLRCRYEGIETVDGIATRIIKPKKRISGHSSLSEHHFRKRIWTVCGAIPIGRWNAFVVFKLDIIREEHMRDQSLDFIDREKPSRAHVPSATEHHEGGVYGNHLVLKTFPSLCSYVRESERLESLRILIMRRVMMQPVKSHSDNGSCRNNSPV